MAVLVCSGLTWSGPVKDADFYHSGGREGLSSCFSLLLPILCTIDFLVQITGVKDVCVGEGVGEVRFFLGTTLQ